MCSDLNPFYSNSDCQVKRVLAAAIPSHLKTALRSPQLDEIVNRHRS